MRLVFTSVPDILSEESRHRAAKVYRFQANPGVGGKEAGPSSEARPALRSWHLGPALGSHLCVALSSVQAIAIVVSCKVSSNWERVCGGNKLTACVWVPSESWAANSKTLTKGLDVDQGLRIVRRQNSDRRHPVRSRPVLTDSPVARGQQRPPCNEPLVLRCVAIMWAGAQSLLRTIRIGRGCLGALLSSCCRGPTADSMLVISHHHCGLPATRRATSKVAPFRPRKWYRF